MKNFVWPIRQLTILSLALCFTTNLCQTAVFAGKIVIDFENPPQQNAPSYSEAGVTFFGQGHAGDIRFSTFSNDTGIISLNRGTRGVPTSASFDNPVNEVGVLIRYWRSSGGLAFLNAYDASGTLVDEALAFVTLRGPGRLEVTGDSISSVVFGEFAPGNRGSLVVALEFDFTRIPEPTTASLALLTWMCFTIFRRR